MEPFPASPEPEYRPEGKGPRPASVATAFTPGSPKHCDAGLFMIAEAFAFGLAEPPWTFGFCLSTTD